MNSTRPLVWEVDGKAYSPSGLAKQVFAMATGFPGRGIQGTARMGWVSGDCTFG
ncbi:hypothetical protein [Actinokineospora terrae]|uniref:Uncharacterized protein n=1 Tax=Actinokineospora terrae TaxID=155974 RepID=A0A1H9VIG2_9PSEU|nr:hypothetical protein [Actinokineospora terrae]SES21359.1 hypothetical protein SAMN04487818_108387 [Actinokineospora terrae]